MVNETNGIYTATWVYYHGKSEDDPLSAVTSSKILELLVGAGVQFIGRPASNPKEVGIIFNEHYKTRTSVQVVPSEGRSVKSMLQKLKKYQESLKA